jgi:hypothetical protein
LGLTPSGGGISFSTRSLVIQEKQDGKKPLLEQNTHWIEILMIFTRYKSSTEEEKILLGVQEHQANQNPSDLILQLAKKMIDKNRGLMEVELEERNNSSISLLLPAEKEGSDLL